ncbi:MAG: hypothetical protein M3441_17770 [Chloroflexota bacterium]|nr:hypothetical protein [Chloroflexota bacterium]
MAGFDLVTEISRETLLKLLKNNLRIGEVLVNPPFELTLPVSGSGTGGSAHLIFTDLQLNLNADDTITLTMAFNRASVTIFSPVEATICPLDGSITINAALQLVNTGGSDRRVAINMGAAAVAINWSDQANNQISQDLSGTSISPTSFKALATQALSGLVRNQPAPTLPFTFTVVPGANGSFRPELQFESLEVHCIPHADPNKQALGLFGILLAANHGEGDHHEKTDTAITAAHDGVCINISPRAFHELIFCPGLADEFDTTPPHLPVSCGPGFGFETNGVTLTHIFNSFANGHIDINGGISKSGPCYEAVGTFHGSLTLDINGTTLTPNLNMDEPDVDVGIPFYCWLAAGYVFGVVGLVIAGIVDIIVNVVVTSMAGDRLNAALGNDIPGTDFEGLPGASFSSTVITTEGLSLQGTVPIFVPHASIAQEIDLEGSVITTGTTALSSGIFHTKVWCMPEPKDYPYTEFAQQQTGTYHLSSALVGLPLTPHFTLSRGSTVVPLTGNSGTVAIPNVETHYPMPLATGGTAMTQTVHVGYSITDTSIQLTNTPSEGNYSLLLSVTVTDCEGNVVRNEFNQMELKTSISVQFEGNHVEIGGGYAADVQYCAQLLREWIKRVSFQYQPYHEVAVWEQVNYPAPERMIEYIRDLVTSEIPQMDEILVASKIAHGNSFYRAIFSEAARQPGLIKSKSKLARDQKRVADIAVQLSRLAQSLVAESGIDQDTGASGRTAGKDIKG